MNAAIAFKVWQYYQVTRDSEFLSFYGAEMLLEIARFWASIASYDEENDRYQILGVMGPDEYHDAYPDAEEPGLDNNAYTNVMAAWVLWRALDVLEILPRDRSQELCLELETSQDLAVSREVRRQDLDGNLPLEIGIHGSVDDPHASPSQLFQNLIPSESGQVWMKC